MSRRVRNGHWGLCGVLAVILGASLPQNTDAAEPPAGKAAPAATAGAGEIAVENELMRLCIDGAGRVTSFSLRGGKDLLERPGSPMMSVLVKGQWHNANALKATLAGNQWQLRVGFAGTAVVAHAVLRSHPRHVELEGVSLEEPAQEKVDEWRLVQLPVNLKAALGGWINVARDDTTAAAVIAIDERTDASGSPHLSAVVKRAVSLSGAKAAIVACPAAQILPILQQIEKQHGLPSPTLGGQWAKTSLEARKSWMITGLTTAKDVPAYQPERVFAVAKKLGVEYVVISLGWWNTTLGSYPINTRYFPQGAASLKVVADEAHRQGLKLGIHVMTGSVSKEDPFVRPAADPRLYRDGEVELAAGLDATAGEIPVRQSPAGFGTKSGYWAYSGTDVEIDGEVVQYRGLKTESPFALTGCTRGAYGTKAKPHTAGAKVRHLTERYGWYVATPELAAEMGRRLAELINTAGLDMVCFDGADVTAVPERRFFDGHQVALGIYRHAKRDVLLVSNGTTHFGWHLMARGGEDDAMARGFQGWVDHYTVHSWGAYQAANLVVPDLSWVGIFPRTPTMTVARPDDIELVAARSLGFDGAIGWAFAACFGGESTVESFARNGRREEIAAVARAYEKLRLENYFSAAERAPLRALGSHWRLLPPDGSHARWRLVPARYLPSAIIRSAAEETATWAIRNEFAEQPLRVRIEALPALAAYGSKENIAVADFAAMGFEPGGYPAAKTTIERTGQTHPQAGAVARLRCLGPASSNALPAKMPGHGQPVWAQAAVKFPANVNLAQHRALGLWVKGDGGGEVLAVQLDIDHSSYLHFYLPITFTGWKYCELGEPEGDRVMDYFAYEKFALHDVPLGQFVGAKLLILNPPVGKGVDLEIGRIEALKELGGQLHNPTLTILAPPLPSGEGRRETVALAIPVQLAPGQSLETGDLWGSRDPSLCRVFDGDGNELNRFTLPKPLPRIAPGSNQVRFSATATPTARAKVTTITLGSD